MEVVNAIRELIQQFLEAYVSVLALCVLVWLVWMRIAEMWRERELFPAWIKKFLFTVLICAILALPDNLPFGAGTAIVAFRVLFFLFMSWKYIDEYLIGGITSGKERSRKRLVKKLEEANSMARKADFSSGKEEKEAYLQLEKKLLAEYRVMLDAHEKKYEKL